MYTTHKKRDRLSINYYTYVDVCVRNVMSRCAFHDPTLRLASLTLASRIRGKKRGGGRAIRVIACLVA